MASKKRTSPLAARLAEVGISPSELSAIVKRPLSEIELWLKAKTLGGEASVLCRPIFASDEAAEAAIQSIRGRTVEGAQYAPMNTFGDDGWSRDAGKVDSI